MIRKTLTAIILAPLVLALVALAIANREIVTVSFDPFSTTEPAYAVKLPLFALIFVVLIAGVIIGGVAAWLKQGRTRRAVRRLDWELRQARAEIGRLRQRLAAREGTLSSATALPLPPPAA